MTDLQRRVWRAYENQRDHAAPPPSKPMLGARAMHVDAPTRDSRSCVDCGALGTKVGDKCECPGCGNEWAL